MRIRRLWSYTLFMCQKKNQTKQKKQTRSIITAQASINMLSFIFIINQNKRNKQLRWRRRRSVAYTYYVWIWYQILFRAPSSVEISTCIYMCLSSWFNCLFALGFHGSFTLTLVIPIFSSSRSSGVALFFILLIFSNLNGKK